MTSASRIAIVDDEPLARERLRRIVEARDDLELVAEAASVAEAARMVEAHRPDILLLDIAMADGTGFDLVASLSAGHTAVIFVTAYAQHATDAFDYAAVDYVTKPINRARVDAALDRARDRLADRAARAELARLRPSGEGDHAATDRRDGFWTRQGERHVFLDIARVLRLEACGDYTKIVTREGEFLINERLTRLAGELDSAVFQQLRRSVVVARANVVAFRQGRFSSLFAILSHGEDVRVGRTFEPHIRAQMGKARPRGARQDKGGS